MDAYLVGGIFDNKPFIQGQSLLYSLCGLGQAITWLYSYHDVDKHVFYNFLFYGSRYNIVGQDKSRIPFTETMSKSEFFWRDAILRINLNEKEGTSILDRAVEKQEFLKTKQKWEVVEYLRQLHDIILDRAYNNRYLVRIDYRETITKKRFQESKYCQYFYSRDYEERDYGPRMKIPDDVDYIVYVFGSPIYVERVQAKEKIHVIDGKQLLYCPDKEIEVYIDRKNGELNEQEALEFIKKKLWDAGLLEESRRIGKEYRDIQRDNHWNDIGKVAFMNLVRKYTTSLPPL